MKKSERYHEAMKAILSAGLHTVEEKIEILETLMEDKGSAEFREKMDAEKAAKEAAQG